jgi:hypothetical protein
MPDNQSELWEKENEEALLGFLVTPPPPEESMPQTEDEPCSV